MKENSGHAPEPDAEYIRCNLCGADDYELVYKGELKSEEGGAPKAVYKSSGSQRSEDTIVKCKRCNLVYVNPRLKGEEIVEGYAEGEDPAFVSQIKGREKTFESGLKFIERFSKPGKILDVGTAGGSFLHVAKKRGWQVYGVEPNNWLCNWAKMHYGLHIIPGTIDDVKFPDEYFDVITLWDVIEHVPDPTAVLKQCRRLLKPGGYIYLNYPDYGSCAARLMRGKWVFLLSVHLTYFTRDTIGKMLEKTDYKPLDYRTHWQTLNLGYLAVKRMKEYSRLISKLANVFVTLTRTKNFPVKYWLGQTGVIAQKR